MEPENELLNIFLDRNLLVSQTLHISSGNLGIFPRILYQTVRQSVDCSLIY